MTHDISITIVIATYNAASCVGQALRSVQNQTVRDWECLVVDGASTDDTLSIVRTFCAADERFRYISEPDNGIYDAYNKGWQQARGEWILYLGADDELYPDAIATLLPLTADADIVYGGVMLSFPNGKQRPRQVNTPAHLRYDMPSGHQAFLMRRRLMEELNGFDMQYRILADFDLMQRAYVLGFNFNYTKAIVAKFAVGGTSTDSLEGEKERYQIIRKNQTSDYPGLIYLANMVRILLLKLKHTLCDGTRLSSK